MTLRFTIPAFAAAAVAAATLTALPALQAVAAEEVNIYSYRKEVLIKPLLDQFTEATGITVNLVSGSADALLERLKAEGANSPADVLLTVDAGRLIRATDAGVLQPVSSKVLEQTIPAQYREPDGHWFGLSIRSRVIFRSKDRVPEGAITAYADLADPKWKGKVCIRSSSNVYNQSLLASIIAHKGAEAAEAWAAGVVANLGRKPQGGDRDQIKAVAAGECDLAVSNTYYYGRMLNSKNQAEREAARKVALVWPNQEGRGAHVNISGAGITKSAKHKANAIKLLEFLVGDAAQHTYSEVVFEYPVKPGVKPSDTVAGFGPFKADTLNLAEFGKHNADAIRIFDRVGWR